MFKPTREILLVIDSIFLALENTKRLKKGTQYIITGFGKGPLHDSERREFWMVKSTDLHNPEKPFSMWKSDINRFHKEGVVQDKGMLK